MATAITRYKASDNLEFDTEAEANAHDKKIELASSLDAFGAERGLKPAQATMAKNYIADYLVWAQSQADAAAVAA